jgi:hypothetical protein
MFQGAIIKAGFAAITVTLIGLVAVAGVPLSSASSTLRPSARIHCDLDCVFRIGQKTGQAAANTPVILSISPGNYVIEVATSDGFDYWTSTVTIPDGAISAIEVVAPLGSERQKRIRRESEIEHLKAEADRKREQLNVLNAHNAQFHGNIPENTEVGNEVVRLIEKYSARYEHELREAIARKAQADQLKPLVPKTWVPQGQNSQAGDSQALIPQNVTPQPGVAQTGSSNTQTALGFVAGAEILKLKADENRHNLAAAAAIHRINELTNLLGALSSGKVKDNARSMLRNIMTFKAWWDAYEAEFWVADPNMELSRKAPSPQRDYQNNSAAARVSFICSEIQDVHTAGPPVVRMVKEYSGTSAFVIKLTSRTLNLRGTDDAARQAMVGSLYLTCPALTVDSGLIFSPSLLTSIERVSWQLNQAKLASKRTAQPSIAGARVPGSRGTVRSKSNAQGAPTTTSKSALPGTQAAQGKRTVIPNGKPSASEMTVAAPSSQVPMRSPAAAPNPGGILLDTTKQKQQHVTGLSDKVEQMEKDAEDVPKKN